MYYYVASSGKSNVVSVTVLICVHAYFKNDMSHL